LPVTRPRLLEILESWYSVSPDELPERIVSGLPEVVAAEITTYNEVECDRLRVHADSAEVYAHTDVFLEQPSGKHRLAPYRGTG
jgi:hypothetical protein